jgi:uncharacterized protein YigA (DUF484 family)
VLASVQMTSPHGNRAVSLQERQAEMLRDKIKTLEGRIMDMIRHSNENALIADKLQRWALGLLRTENPLELPERITAELRGQFQVPQVAIKVWGVAPQRPAAVCARRQRGRQDLCLLADRAVLRRQPGFEAVQWLPDPAAVVSLALLPLRGGAISAASPAFGLLVLASPDRSASTAAWAPSSWSAWPSWPAPPWAACAAEAGPASRRHGRGRRFHRHGRPRCGAAAALPAARARREAPGRAHAGALHRTPEPPGGAGRRGRAGAAGGGTAQVRAGRPSCMARAWAGAASRWCSRAGAASLAGREAWSPATRWPMCAPQGPRPLPKALAVDEAVRLAEHAEPTTTPGWRRATPPWSSCFTAAACGWASWSAWTCGPAPRRARARLDRADGGRAACAGQGRQAPQRAAGPRRAGRAAG